MTLSKSSVLVQYAFLLSDRYRQTGPPDLVSLCALFWRCAFTTLFAGGALAVVSTLLFIVSSGIGWLGHRLAAEPGVVMAEVAVSVATPSNYWPPLLIAAIVGAFATIVYAIEHKNSWLHTIFWAIKHRVCPVIQLEGEAGVVPDVPDGFRELVPMLRNHGFAATYYPMDDDMSERLEIPVAAKGISGEAQRLHGLIGKDWDVEAEFAPARSNALLIVSRYDEDSDDQDDENEGEETV